MATKPQQTFEHGSPEAWEDVFAGLDLSYSEEADTQGKLFEMMKIGFMETILPKPPKKMVEIGCGTAFVSLYFAKRGYLATCMDINQPILDAAEENFRRENIKGEFVCGDAEKLPFADNMFDIVTSFGLLEHFEDPQIAISEMARVLKPGGFFFADIVPARFSCQTFGSIFNMLASFGYWTSKGKVKTGIEKAMYNFKPPYYENRFSLKEYYNMITKAGITDIEVRGNRPFPRLTLPPSFDKAYAGLLKPTIPVWKRFDNSKGPFSKFWGAGWWFWGIKH